MRAVNATLKRGGSHIFYVIAQADGLNEDQLGRIASRDGNEHVRAESSYDELMEQAGFVSVQLTDVTDDYLTTLLGWRRHWEADRASFVELVGEEDFEMRMGRRATDIANVEDGLLKRYLVTGLKL